MTRDDLRHFARLLIERNGVRAEDEACRQLRRLTVRGDLAGCTLWAGILAAINALRQTERRCGEAVH